MLVAAVAGIAIGAVVSLKDKIWRTPVKDKAAIVIHTPKKRVFCYKYEPKYESIIGVQMDKKDKTGRIQFIPTSEAFEGTRPLAFQCQQNGDIWWVSKNTMYSGRINCTKSNCKIVNVESKEHTSVPEYKNNQGTEVIAAGIFWPRNSKKPYITTITNDGWVHGLRPPVSGPVIKERFIVSLYDNASLRENERWPEVSKARISPVGTKGISIIAIGGKDSYVHILYYLQLEKGYHPLTPAIPWVMDMKSSHPVFRTIINATPIIYDEDRGGWVSQLTGITLSGAITKPDKIVIPKEVLEERQVAGKNQGKK